MIKNQFLASIYIRQFFSTCKQTVDIMQYEYRFVKDLLKAVYKSSFFLQIPKNTNVYSLLKPNQITGCKYIIACQLCF